MPARRVPALALPVDPGAGVSFLGYEHRTPLLTIATGRPALLVTLTLPEHLEAGHVDFARQLAAKAWAYAVAVERRYRGLPPLPDAPVPYTLTAKAEALPGCRPGTGGPGAAARWPGGDGMTAVGSGPASARTARPRSMPTSGCTASTHIQCCTYDDAAPDPVHPRRRGRHHDHQPRPGRGHRTRTWPSAASWPTPWPGTPPSWTRIAARNRPTAAGPDAAGQAA